MHSWTANKMLSFAPVRDCRGLRAAVRIAALATLAQPAWAAPISISQTYQFLDNVSINNVGIAKGYEPELRQQLGSTCVVLVGNPCAPNDPANAVNTLVSALQGSSNVTVSYVPSSLTSNHWAYARTAGTLPTGQWSLIATNGANSATALTPSLSGALQMGFAQGAAIQQNGLSPTFSWLLPSTGAPVQATTVLIRDIQDPLGGISSIIYRSSLASGATSFTPTASGFVPGFSLQFGHSYALEIQLQDTRDNTSNGSFPNVLSQSRSYLNFMLSNTSSAAPEFLPMVANQGGTPVYHFEGVPVQAGQTVLIDPDVAVGFDYQVRAGDPLFRSVTLPAVGDGTFMLWLWNGVTWAQAATLSAGVEFLLPSGGVDRFRITGIEPDAALDPFTPGSFTTGVSFVTSGTFSGTMTPLTVPEPAMVWLWAAGGLVLGAAGRRHRK